MTPETRNEFDAYAALREAEWKEWENKSHYEWKVSITIWAGLALLVAAFVGRERPPVLGLCGSFLFVFGGLAMFVLHVLFLIRIHARLKENRTIVNYWRSKMVSIVPDGDSRPVPAMANLQQFSFALQVAVSVFLLAILLFFVLTGLEGTGGCR